MSVSRVRENLMHGLTGGSWKRSHDHRTSFLPYSMGYLYELAVRVVILMRRAWSVMVMW
jgi:hypothetical protein